MTEQHPLQHNLHATSIGKRALQGASMAIVLLAVFLLGGEVTPRPWLLLPACSVAIAGACGGIFYFLMDRVRQHGGWRKLLADVICALAYIVGLWISLILACKITGHWS